MEEHEWLGAQIKLDTEDAALAVLNRLCEGKIRDAFRLFSAIAGWARKYPSIRAEVIKRYRAAAPAGGNTLKMLEMAMDDLADEEAFMALFEGHVGTSRPIAELTHAIRNLAIGRKPSEKFEGAFVEFGVPLASLRARLFAMLPANDARARLAKECLIAIDEHRDDHGRLSSEPRHPDIGTGRAWPPEVDETKATLTA